MDAREGGDNRRPLPLGVWIAAAAVFVILLGVSSRYGFHRDELYFIAAGRRLAWGFVDQPPLTPLVARLADLLPGGVSPSVLRVVPALSAAGLVVLAGVLTRRFGGGSRAVALGAGFAAVGGFYLAVGHLLSTTTFDVLIWVGVCAAVAAIIDGADPRLWIVVGGLVGVGMVNKYTIASLGVVLLIGLLLTPARSVLRGPMPWLGAGVAILIALPNLAWQATQGWPQFEMAAALRRSSDGPFEYVLLQIAILSFFLVIPTIGGAVWLSRDPAGRRWRVFPIAFVLLFVVYFATGGKGYYVAPLYVPLLAGGAVWLESSRRWVRRTTVALVGMGAVLGLFIALPLVPPESVDAFNEVNGELGETYAWDQLVDQIEAVFLDLSEAERESAAVLTSNYGQAGAIEVLSDALPQPVSGHNNYWLWGPPAGESSVIIGIGRVGPAINEICPFIEVVAVISNDADVANDENGTEVWLCRSPSAPLSSVWDELKHYN